MSLLFTLRSETTQLGCFSHPHCCFWHDAPVSRPANCSTATAGLRVGEGGADVARRGVKCSEAASVSWTRPIPPTSLYSCCPEGRWTPTANWCHGPCAKASESPRQRGRDTNLVVSFSAPLFRWWVWCLRQTREWSTRTREYPM